MEYKRKYGEEYGKKYAVAWDSGELSQERWLSYQKLKSENSYVQNRGEYLTEKNLKNTFYIKCII